MYAGYKFDLAVKSQRSTNDHHSNKNLVDLESPMLYTKTQHQSFLGPGEENLWAYFVCVWGGGGGGVEQYLWWLFRKIWSANNFLLIWPGDLVFDPMWPSFELDLEIIKTNILSKILDDCLKKMWPLVLTKFSADFAWWPSFWSEVTQFLTWPRTHQDKHFEQDSWWLLQKCDR